MGYMQHTVQHTCRSIMHWPLRKPFHKVSPYVAHHHLCHLFCIDATAWAVNNAQRMCTHA